MRAELHCSYILHRRRYRETSFILDCFSAEFGRVGVVARGAARRRKRGNVTMQPFQQYQASWSGRSELLTLIKLEPHGRVLPLAGERLFSGFYVNELLMRVTTRHDPNPELYAVYDRTLSELAASSGPIEPLLRNYEKSLLDACGYGMQLLEESSTGARIEAAEQYRYIVEHGPVLSSTDGFEVSGATLLALAGMREYRAAELAEAKRLMRIVLQHYIGDRPLSSRSLFKTPRRPSARPNC